MSVTTPKGPHLAVQPTAAKDKAASSARMRNPSGWPLPKRLCQLAWPPRTTSLSPAAWPIGMSRSVSPRHHRPGAPGHQQHFHNPGPGRYVARAFGAPDLVRGGHAASTWQWKTRPGWPGPIAPSSVRTVGPWRWFRSITWSRRRRASKSKPRAVDSALTVIVRAPSYLLGLTPGRSRDQKATVRSGRVGRGGLSSSRFRASV